MGCHGYDSQSTHCVKDTVHQIVRAQREAAEKDTVTCLTSCERSINDLLSPKKDSRRRHTTIPFMLICKNSCNYFIGRGVVKRWVNGARVFECLESPVFKARGFAKGSNSCVKLELLMPISNDTAVEPEPDGCSPCKFFPTNDAAVNGFRETGVCITVDLNSFNGIACLDPITPEKAI